MPKQISLVNLRTYRSQDYFYIGRPGKGQTSILGNPFSRKEAISLYRQWLWKNHIKPWLETGIESDVTVELIAIAEMNKEYEVKLGCFCHPQPCHGEVIISAIQFIQKPWIIITGEGSFSESLVSQLHCIIANNGFSFLNISDNVLINKVICYFNVANYPHFFICGDSTAPKTLKVSHDIESLCQYKLAISGNDFSINKI